MTYSSSPAPVCTGTIHNDKIYKAGGAAGSMIWSITQPGGPNPACTAAGAAAAQWNWKLRRTNLGGQLTPTTIGPNYGGHFTEGLTSFCRQSRQCGAEWVDVRVAAMLVPPDRIIPVYPLRRAHRHALRVESVETILIRLWDRPRAGRALPPTFAWANEIVGFQPSAAGKQFRFASSYITGLSPFFSNTICDWQRVSVREILPILF